MLATFRDLGLDTADLVIARLLHLEIERGVASRTCGRGLRIVESCIRGRALSRFGWVVLEDVGLGKRCSFFV